MIAVQDLVQKAVDRDVKRFQQMKTSPGSGAGAGPGASPGTAAVRGRYKGQGEGVGTVDIDRSLLPFLRGGGGDRGGGGGNGGGGGKGGNDGDDQASYYSTGSGIHSHTSRERGYHENRTATDGRSGTGTGTGTGNRSGVGVGVVGVYPHVAIAESFWLCGEIVRVRGDIVGARNLLSSGRWCSHVLSHTLLIYFHPHYSPLPSTSLPSTPLILSLPLSLPSLSHSPPPLLPHSPPQPCPSSKNFVINLHTPKPPLPPLLYETIKPEWKPTTVTLPVPLHWHNRKKLD